MLTQEDDVVFRPNGTPIKGQSISPMTLIGTHSSPSIPQDTTQQSLAAPRQNPAPRNGQVVGTPGAASIRPASTPSRRLGAPTSIPNFPSANDHRNPVLPPSPIRSPGPSSPPIQSPPTPNTTSSTPFKIPSTMSLSSLRSGPPSSSAASSPWQFLGATSGAPTPSLDGPGRSSPHLGGPFEQLNLNGSWSGGNLWAEGSQAGSSTEVLPLATPSRSGSAGSGAGMNAEMLAKYRNMAGRASASGSRGESSGTPMEGVESQSSPVKPSLPAALARRRGSIPKANLTLPNTAIHSVKSPSPLGGPSSGKTSPSELQPLAATDMARLESQPSTLVLDVRPPSAYLAGHLRSAHSIPIPSTLIRRPAFTVDKVLLMLSPESRDAVQAWKGMINIILLDADSTTAGSGTLLEGLASKFTREGFGGKMWFVKGGQTALEAIPSSDMVSVAQESDGMTSPGPSTLSPSGNFNAGGLGSLAFLHGKFSLPILPVSPLDGLGDTIRAPLSFPGSTGGGVPVTRNSTGGFPFIPSATNKSNPFDGAMSPAGRPLSLKGMMLGGDNASNQAGSGTSGSTGSYKPKLQPANPFFDNIRQNLELSHGGITERIPLHLGSEARRRAHELPAWLSELVTLSEADGADRLAQQFYTVERNEQKRLQALMDWHTEGSGAVLPGTTSDDLGKKGKATSWARQQKKDRADVDRLEEWGKGHRGGTAPGEFGQPSEEGQEYYPFSITAGVERGIKNRYKNIWPYDFSRVRLVTPCEDESDYINASYIQPRGTSKRYIATQGPLDATFRDFWTLIWEQEVRVIVMLTKQFEGGQVKCGNYWQDCHYGPLHLRLDGQSGGEDFGRPAQTAGFDFGAPSPSASKGSSNPDIEITNIRRTFILTNDNHPSDPPRKIIQIQCVSWPDFDVPTSPDVLLGLIKDVLAARKEIDEGEVQYSEDCGDDAPVLIHCSAGIGRTGSFILVDSILDALAKGRRQQRRRDEELQKASSMPVPVPVPASISARSSVVHSRHASGSPKGAGMSESADSVLTKGHSGRVKSVSFASGDKVVLPGAAGSEGEKGKRSNVGKGTSSSGLGISMTHSNSTNTNSNTNSNSTSNLAPAPATASKSASAPIKLSAQPQTQAFDWLPSNHAQIPANSNMVGGVGEAMEVDSPSEYPPSQGEQNQSINQWLQYREEEASEAGTAAIERRPSLASIYTSEEKLSSEKLSPVDEDPRPIAVGHTRARSPTPLSQMENPVLDVLESMRVQRMSLVQSLRQFVFAYKVIIHESFAMLDEENARDKRIHSTTSASAATAGVVGAGAEDDDSTQKRRASPTELAHDRPSLELEDDERRPAVAGALGRKASVKRMKQEVAGAGSGHSK